VEVLEHQDRGAPFRQGLEEAPPGGEGLVAAIGAGVPYRFEIGHTLVLDANVLWYSHLLGVLIYCHHKTILSLKWTDTIVDEAETAMRADGRARHARTGS
jgi:hypothetical protein